MLTMSPQSEGPRTPRATNLRGGRFDPLTAIAWHTAFYAGDPLWSNPGNGNLVSSWRDGSGNGRTATQATSGNQPTFRSSDVAYNNQPIVDFTAASRWMATASFTAVPQPLSIVYVANPNDLTGNRYIVGNTGTWDNAPGTDASWFRMYGGGLLTSSVASTKSPRFVVAYFNGASSKMTVGATATTGNAGTDSTSMLALANTWGTTSPVKIGFLGLYAGDVTTSGQWSAFKTWVNTTYGVTT